MNKHTFTKTLIATAILSVTQPAMTCTALIVGKAASNNNTIMIARNEDFDNNNWGKHLVYRPAQQPTESQWDFGNGLIVPMPKQLYAYSAIPDWDAHTVNPAGKYFEERGINEFNVAISATNSAAVNEKAQKADPLTQKGGITESVIPSLILPQVKTAREGVELLGQYIATYGAGEGNVLYFADPNELWMMEIGSGHHWVAVKVPEDVYVIVANSLQIHNIDLDDKNTLHSENLWTFVQENKLLEKPDRQSFNFAKAFGVLSDRYNTDRVWLGQQYLTPSIKQAPEQAQYPLFMKPDKPISLDTVKSVLSLDYKGSEIEKTGKRPIRVERQLESHILTLRPDAPTPLQGVIWQSFGVLSESLLVPIYNTVTEYPKAYQRGEDIYQADSAYWQFRGLTTLANTNPERYYPFIRSHIKQKQEALYQSFYQIDTTLIKDYSINADNAITASATFSIEALEKASQIATQLQNRLLTDMTKSSEEKYTDKEKEATLSLPKE